MNMELRSIQIIREILRDIFLALSDSPLPTLCDILFSEITES